MEEQLPLFEMPAAGPKAPVFKPFTTPVWTENKAKLIARYLHLFVMITKHGLYMDGFAAPQQPDSADSWAAKLVIETVPFLREYWLFERNRKRFAYLRDLVAGQPTKRPAPRFNLVHGDFNKTVEQALRSGRITEKTATFCLLDQWTFECQWSTVRALAEHKKEGNKIELFYFLASGWLDRSMVALTRNPSKATEWWGSEEWRKLKGMDGNRRAWLMCDRFKQELGYAYALPFPIFAHGDTGTVMYHMIHATDHPEAPKLMVRAYRQATNAPPPIEEPELDLDSPGPITIEL